MAETPAVATLSVALLGVFIADLVVTYRRVGEPPARFVRTHWLDILLVIPLSFRTSAFSGL